MPENVDTSVNNGFEKPKREFSPEKNPSMHRVVVKTEIQSGLEIGQRGWETTVRGARIDLQQISEHNEHKREQRAEAGIYERIYFRTITGPIYRALSREDGTWELEASTNPRSHIIREPAIIEVGQSFQLLRHMDGQPELTTSPVQNITIVDQVLDSGFSKEATDVGTEFARAVQVRGGTVR